MGFPQPNAFEKYSSTKLFRQLIDINDDAELVIRAKIDSMPPISVGTVAIEDPSRSGFFSDTADDTDTSHTTVDLNLTTAINVVEIVVINDGSNNLYVNFNALATTGSYAILPGEGFTFNISEADGSPIANIHFICDTGLTTDFRCFYFGVDP
jgi:hypothetical protein